MDFIKTMYDPCHFNPPSGVTKGARLLALIGMKWSGPRPKSCPALTARAFKELTHFFPDGEPAYRTGR
jgi:hypothetical protein